MKGRIVYGLAGVLLLVYTFAVDLLPGPFEEILSSIEAVLLLLKAINKVKL